MIRSSACAPPTPSSWAGGRAAASAGRALIVGLYTPTGACVRRHPAAHGREGRARRPWRRTRPASSSGSQPLDAGARLEWVALRSGWSSRFPRSRLRRRIRRRCGPGWREEGGRSLHGGPARPVSRAVLAVGRTRRSTSSRRTQRATAVRDDGGRSSTSRGSCQPALSASAGWRRRHRRPRAAGLRPRPATADRSRPPRGGRDGRAVAAEVASTASWACATWPASSRCAVGLADGTPTYRELSDLRRAEAAAELMAAIVESTMIVAPIEGFITD